MLWFPLVDVSNEMALFGYYLLMLFLFDTIFTTVGIITYILPAEMTVSSVERGSLMVYATVIGLIGYLITFIVPMLFLTGDESSYIDPAFLISMVLIGIFCSIIIFISSYFIKENDYTQLEEPLDFVDSIKESFKNRPFLILQVANFAGILTSTIITSSIFYYVNYILVLTDFMSVVPILVVLLIAFPFTYVYLRVIPKYGLKKINIFGYCMICISFVLLLVLGWDLSTAMISLIILGVGYGASLVTSQILFADTVDYDETRTGKRRESTYSGVEALITKPAISVANGLFLLVISAFGFDNAATTQSTTAQWGIMIGFAVMPIFCALIAAIVMSFYPLDGPEWNKQKEELQQIHERKEKEYIEHIKNKEKQ
jgi:GPH family glycoside/pentoside/hexuronide:cation symporter